MFNIAFAMGGPQDILIIGALVLLLFGGSKLAGFGKGAGDALREFKKATRDDETSSSVTTTATASPITPAVVPVAPTVTTQETGRDS